MYVQLKHVLTFSKLLMMEICTGIVNPNFKKYHTILRTIDAPAKILHLTLQYTAKTQLTRGMAYRNFKRLRMNLGQLLPMMELQ